MAIRTGEVALAANVTVRVPPFLFWATLADASCAAVVDVLVANLVVVVVVPTNVVVPPVVTPSKVPPLPGCGSSGAPCWSPHSASSELVRPSSP